ncbi:hypothetical protein MBLNU457_4380t2 [Dothideomycetes sp. NU457]
MTGVKSLKSKSNAVGRGRSSNRSSESTSVDEDKKAPRFSKPQVKILREWFADHADSPYPTEDQKLDLERRTGLRPAQIATWLANTRRRTRVVNPKRAPSPAVRHASETLDMPAPANARPWSDLNPFERWQHSPPENDPAPIHAIADAVASSDLPGQKSSSSSTPLGYRGQGSSTSSFSGRKGPHSVTSLETGKESNSLSTASSAVRSQGSHSSFGSFNSFGSGLLGKKDRHRKRKVRANNARQLSDEDKRKRIYQCTFCCDSFKSKYDWTRHEKSLHLSLEQWVCQSDGSLTRCANGEVYCAYCSVTNPDEAHLQSHGHQQCAEKGTEARTFYRKDHLRQHLRLMHDCEFQPHMESWKQSLPFVNSRCGICTARFTRWDDRNDHLAAHFKEGRTMAEWRGCRGLDPTIAANVSYGMPPYLIGMESMSPHPFSAGNHTAWYNTVPTKMLNQARAAGLDQNIEYGQPEDQPVHPALASKDVIGDLLEQMGNPSRATCWEILAIALGRYVKEQVKNGVVINDEMLQRQARRILYDSDDAWNQTAADNPEWLDLFKKAHGLDIIPDNIGDIGGTVPEDLETYGDLGMRIPFCILLEKGVDPTNLPAASDFLHEYAKEQEKAKRQFDKQNFASGQTYHIPQGIPGRGDYLPRSSMVVPLERVKDFATMRETSFESGRLGKEVQTAGLWAEHNNMRMLTAADVPVAYTEAPQQMGIDPDMVSHSQLHAGSISAETRPNSLLAFSTPDTVSPGQLYDYSGFMNEGLDQNVYSSAAIDMPALNTAGATAPQDMNYDSSMANMNNSFDTMMNTTAEIEDFDFNFDLGFDFDAGNGDAFTGLDIDMGI